METKKIIEEVISLPIEERVLIADSILRSLNPTESNIDKIWIKVANTRLEKLKSGKIKAVPGDEVFNNIWQKFSA